MIHRTYGSFGELYMAELVSREFDVVDVKGGVVIAKYKGSCPLRRRDLDLEVRVVKRENSDGWNLTADDNFYCNMAHISLGGLQEMELGPGTGGRAVYGLVKLFRVDLLKDGVPKRNGDMRIKQPVCRGDVYTCVAMAQVEELARQRVDISSSGFSPEELELFGLKREAG